MSSITLKNVWISFAFQLTLVLEMIFFWPQKSAVFIHRTWWHLLCMTTTKKTVLFLPGRWLVPFLSVLQNGLVGLSYLADDIDHIIRDLSFCWKSNDTRVFVLSMLDKKYQKTSLESCNLFTGLKRTVLCFFFFFLYFRPPFCCSLICQLGETLHLMFTIVWASSKFRRKILPLYVNDMIKGCLW